MPKVTYAIAKKPVEPEAEIGKEAQAAMGAIAYFAERCATSKSNPRKYAGRRIAIPVREPGGFGERSFYMSEKFVANFKWLVDSLMEKEDRTA